MGWGGKLNRRRWKRKETIGGDPKICAPIVGKVDEASLEEKWKERTITEYEKYIWKESIATIMYITFWKRKFRRGGVSKLNKKNGESPNSHSVSPSSHRPATRENREIVNGNFDHASDDCKGFQESLCLQLYELSMGTYAIRTPKGANAHRRTQ